MNNLSLGFIGVGLMGLSLIRRLSNLNYKIEAYDKNLEKLKPLKKITNVRLNQNASKMSKNNNIIILCLDKTENVKEVVFGKNGIVNNAYEDTIVLDLSTTLANETINFANKLNKKTGAAWIDAPVSGGPDKALEGNLAIMVGGDEKFVENVKPSLIFVTISSVPVRTKLFVSVETGVLATGVTVSVKSPPSGSLIFASISFD